jgi:hypothetical protein
MSARIQAAAAALFVAACVGPAPAPDGVYFPRFRAQDQEPLAAPTATLSRDGPCLLLVQDQEEWLGVWSSKFRAVDVGEGRIGIVDSLGNPVAIEGEEAVFGGAHYGSENVDFIEKLVERPIDAPCIRQDGFFLVADIPSRP